MNEYQRLVSYIYAYSSGVKGINTGYAKVMLRQETMKINISLHNVVSEKNNTMREVYLVINDESTPTGEKKRYLLYSIGTMLIDKGQGEFNENLNSNNINGSNITFSDIKGIAIGDSKNMDSFMFSLWEDGEINQRLVTITSRGYKKSVVSVAEAANINKSEIRKIDNKKNQEVNNVKGGQEKKEIQERRGAKEKLEKAEELNQQEKQKLYFLKKSDKNPYEQLYVRADFVDAFDDDYFYDCIEVNPEQLKKLKLPDKEIVENSFLIHGYYNFRHVLFGRVRENDNNTKYFVGVPGVYCNRERFMASMYGFNNFKRSHRADCNNPYFGYWYQEI